MVDFWPSHSHFLVRRRKIPRGSFEWFGSTRTDVTRRLTTASPIRSRNSIQRTQRVPACGRSAGCTNDAQACAMCAVAYGSRYIIRRIAWLPARCDYHSRTENALRGLWAGISRAFSVRPHLPLSPGWEMTWARNEIAPAAKASRRFVRIGAVQLNATFLQSSVFALSAASVVAAASTLSRASMKRPHLTTRLREQSFLGNPI